MMDVCRCPGRGQLAIPLFRPSRGQARAVPAVPRPAREPAVPAAPRPGAATIHRPAARRRDDGCLPLSRPRPARDLAVPAVPRPAREPAVPAAPRPGAATIHRPAARRRDDGSLPLSRPRPARDPAVPAVPRAGAATIHRPAARRRDDGCLPLFRPRRGQLASPLFRHVARRPREHGSSRRELRWAAERARHIIAAPRAVHRPCARARANDELTRLVWPSIPWFLVSTFRGAHHSPHMTGRPVRPRPRNVRRPEWP